MTARTRARWGIWPSACVSWRRSTRSSSGSGAAGRRPTNTTSSRRSPGGNPPRCSMPIGVTIRGAETLARETVRLADDTDDPTAQADTRLVLADTLRIAGRTEDAKTALRTTIELFEAKGNVLGTAHARRRLDALQEAVPSSASTTFRPGASRPRRPRKSRSRAPGRTRSRATGRAAARPARACGSASSTAASTPATRPSARCSARSSSPTAKTASRASPRHRGRRLRARHRLRRDRPRARAGVRAPQRPRARRRATPAAGSPARRPALGDRAGLRRRQHEPLDDEEGTTRPSCTSSPTRAYFKRTVLVASAHNMPVESYPWRFSSVISVGSHVEEDPMVCTTTRTRRSSSSPAASTSRSPGSGGETIRCTGNSFATPHVAGICALIRSKHPELTPFELKSVLHLTSRTWRPAMSDDLSAAVAAGVLGAEERFRELLRRSSRSRGRSSARRRLPCCCSTRRATSSSSRPSPARARRRSSAALPGEHGRRRLGARDAAAARDRGRDARPALRAGRRRVRPATCRRD